MITAPPPVYVNHTSSQQRGALLFLLSREGILSKHSRVEDLEGLELVVEKAWISMQYEVWGMLWLCFDSGRVGKCGFMGLTNLMLHVFPFPMDFSLSLSSACILLETFSGLRCAHSSQTTCMSATTCRCTTCKWSYSCRLFVQNSHAKSLPVGGTFCRFGLL